MSKTSKEGQNIILRKQAEEIALNSTGKQPEDIETMSQDQIRIILHELRVHQIELEMQNEELRRTEQELENSRLRYFKLYDLAPIGFLTLNEKGFILEANLTAGNILGVARNSLVGKLITGYIIKEDQDIYYYYRRQLSEPGKQKVCELRMRQADQQVFWARMEAARAEGTSDLSEWHVMLSNITEQTLARENFLKLAERQSALLSAIPDIIMEVDMKKVYTWANLSGIEFFGEDVIGREASFYFEGHQETYHKVLPLFQGIKDAFYVESWQRRKDGEKRLLAWWCRTLKDDQGQVIGALSSAQDITERKAAEQELRNQTEDLQTLNSFFVDREIQMINLKKEINELLIKSGFKEKYIIHTE